MTPNRCCRDSLKLEQDKLHALHEGLEVPCRWCQAPMIIRCRYVILGGHVHVRVFTSKAKNMTFAKCGDLSFSVEEWGDVRDMLHSAVEFLPDEVADWRATGTERTRS